MSREHHTHQLADASLKVTPSLPNGETTVDSDPIDLGVVGDDTAFLAACELKISAPALTTAQLPDDETITYTVEHADDEDFNTNAETLHSALGVQTGAGGAGAEAAVYRMRFPSTVRRFVRVNVIKTGAANASAASASVAVVF